MDTEDTAEKIPRKIAVTFFRLPSTVSGRLMSKHSKTASESL